MFKLTITQGVLLILFLFIWGFILGGSYCQPCRCRGSWWSTCGSCTCASPWCCCTCGSRHQTADTRSYLRTREGHKLAHYTIYVLRLMLSQATEIVWQFAYAARMLYKHRIITLRRWGEDPWGILLSGGILYAILNWFTAQRTQTIDYSILHFTNILQQCIPSLLSHFPCHNISFTSLHDWSLIYAAGPVVLWQRKNTKDRKWIWWKLSKILVGIVMQVLIYKHVLHYHHYSSHPYCTREYTSFIHKT